jgi:hypothetical protein
MNETAVTTIMITGWNRVFSCGDPDALAADQFQIHHTTLQVETPDHECSLCPRRRSD